MRSVVILAPVHYYDDTRVFQKEAKTLAADGYRVLLLARAEHSLIEEGVEVIPLPLVKRRLLRFLSLPRVFWRALRLNGDVYHLHNPDTLPIALLLKLLGRRVIYDSHEDFSKDILERQWIPRMLRPFLAKWIPFLEGVVGRVADRSIAPIPSVRRLLGNKAVMIENLPVSQGPLVDRAYAYAETLPNDAYFRVVYVGTIGSTRGLFTMVDALEIVNRSVPCRLWLIGPSHDDTAIIEAKARSGWRFVDYIGKLPQSQAFGYVIKSDAGLVAIPDVGGNSQLSSNKLYEYQLFGVPFIASDFEKWRNSMQVGSGLFVRPGDTHDLAEKMVWLAEHADERKEMGVQGRNLILTSYNWEVESEKLLTVYRDILGRA